MKKILILFLIFTACSDHYDARTPEGAHYLLVKAFTERQYAAIYPMLTEQTHADFETYLRQTREVIAIIRESYPVVVRLEALADLSIPFEQRPFTIDDIESSPSTEDAFAKLCAKMFGKDFSLMQEYGAKIGSVEYVSETQAVITTIAEEKLTYVREKDGVWRTADIFGNSFAQLARVSGSNLSITKTNAELYAK